MGDGDVAARLERVLASIEPTLTRLGVERLLNEILDRVREALDADTAAVLLHEEGTDHLLARAARGLEEEVRQGVRVPIGTGFAGRIADTRKPVRLQRVDASTVSNPILWEKGIERMLGVPLLSGGDLLGVLHVGRLGPRDFDVEDETLLQVAAERVTLAVQRQRYETEAAAADLLERGLLPPHLPQVTGVQFASRYVPTENRAIGGDWYDAFVMPDGALWVVTGDVAGHGLRAAVVMGRVKSALRAYTLLGESPARVLELTDRKVLHFEMGAMITVICARSYPPFDRWTICSAGHLPPLLARPGHPTVLADVPPGPPLGAEPSCRREEVTLDLSAGALLALYTDGLVERRDEELSDGLARLTRVVRAEEPDVVCRTVMREVVGAGAALDDIALLVVHRSGTPEHGGTRVRAFAPELDAPPAARRFALDAAGPLSEERSDTLQLLVSELTSNVVRHAGTPFEIAVTRTESKVRVEVCDSAAEAVTMRAARPSEPHGRGLAIVAALASDWGVREGPAQLGKIVWFSIDLTEPSAAAEATLTEEIA